MHQESWARLIEIVPIGLLSGLLAGAFGVGGGIISVPLVRHILGLTAHEAVGSTLAMILPTALIGVFNYLKQGKLMPKLSFICSGPAILGTVLASALCHYVHGKILMLLLAGLMVLVGLDFLTGFGNKLKADALAKDSPTDAALQSASTEPPTTIGQPDSSKQFGSTEQSASASTNGFNRSASTENNNSTLKTENLTMTGRELILAAVIGLLVGVLSGMLGIGGGFIMVPSFCYFLGLPLKVAFGTSLIVVALVALPGTIVHAMHNHVLPWVVVPMLIGSLPGAWLGSYFSLKAKDRVLRVVFGAILLVMSIVFAIKEINA